MSAPLIPVLVMRMLIAPTLTVLLAVHVNKDSLEMGHFVKVCKNSDTLYFTSVFVIKLKSVVFFQISMSAPLILVFVMKTLIVPTATVLTVVHVNKDSLEMGHFVKVCKIADT